jgi:endonuclease V-like protein UPF0215 family
MDVPRRLTNVVGFDDGPFARDRPGSRVRVVGAVCARTRLDGVISGHVRKDGRDATVRLAALIQSSPFDRHIRAVLLDGITFGGFNVVDIHALSDAIGRPVLAIARKPPRFELIRAALSKMPGGDRRWAAIVRAGRPESLAGLYVQRAGLTPEEAGQLLAATTLHGKIPEPIRLAHLIAGGVVTGASHGRA